MKGVTDKRDMIVMEETSLWKKFIKFLFKTWPKIIITIILSLCLLVLDYFIEKPENRNWILFFAKTIIIIIETVYSFLAAIDGKVNKEQIEEMENHFNAYGSYFENIPNLLDKQSAGLNKIANDIKNKQTLSENRWTEDDAADSICYSIMSFLRNYCNAHGKIHVSYIKKIDEVKIILTGSSDRHAHVPLNNTPRIILNSATSLRDEIMFAQNTIEFDFGLNSKNVDNAYKLEDRKKYVGKYEQYLFIPVSCDQKNVIGIIEILTYKGVIIAKKPEDMLNLKNLLESYSSIIVLLNKAEQAATALPGN